MSSMYLRARRRISPFVSHRNGPSPTVTSRFRNMLCATDSVGISARSW